MLLLPMPIPCIFLPTEPIYVLPTTPNVTTWRITNLPLVRDYATPSHRVGDPELHS